MRIFLQAAIFAGVVWWVAPAHARTDIILNEAGFELRFDVDETGTAEVFGLPFAGRYLYSSTRETLYIWPDPQKKDVYFLPLANLRNKLPQASLVDLGLQGNPYLGLETRKWKVRFPLRTCAEVETSAQAGRDLNFTLADIIHVNALLAHIYADEPEESCKAYVVSAAAARLAGLPLHSVSTTGESKVTGLVPNADPPHTLPVAPRPVTEETIARLLAARLNEEYRAVYEQTSPDLPAPARVKVLRRLLEKQFAPKLPKGRKWAPPMIP